MNRKSGFFLRYLWVLALSALGLVTLCSAPRTPRESLEENRMLAGFPALTWDSLIDGSFTTGVEEWLSDGIAGRAFLVDAAERVRQLFALEKDDAAMAEEVMAALEAETAAATPDVPGDADASETAAPDMPEEHTVAQTGVGTETLPIEKTSFWVSHTDGSVDYVYSFPVENVKNAISIFNTFQALLPEDGHVIFAEVPIAETGNSYQRRRNGNVAWGSDVEAQLQAHAAEGVLIVNGSQALLEPLENNEYVYFRTDHHWTPLGAFYLYRAMMEAQGVSPMDYEDYDYIIHEGMIGSASNSQPVSSLKSIADRMEVICPISPVECYLLTKVKHKEAARYMFPERRGYTAYLGGTQGPWRLYETGFQTGRTALVIGDSFSNAFLPFLLPHYDRVLKTDLRPTYYDVTIAGAGVKQYMEAYGVDDVYIVVCFATSINSGFFVNGTILEHLDEEVAE